MCHCKQRFLGEMKMDIKRIFIASFRMYFAPIVGAYKEVMIERERLQQRLKNRQ